MTHYITVQVGCCTFSICLLYIIQSYVLVYSGTWLLPSQSQCAHPQLSGIYYLKIQPETMTSCIMHDMRSHYNYVYCQCSIKAIVAASIWVLS